MTGSDEAQMKYEAPEIVDYGDLTALTAGSADGRFLDADFPVGTSRGDLGFSN